MEADAPEEVLSFHHRGPAGRGAAEAHRAASDASLRSDAERDGNLMGEGGVEVGGMRKVLQP